MLKCGVALPRFLLEAILLFEVAADETGFYRFVCCLRDRLRRGCLRAGGEAMKGAGACPFRDHLWNEITEQ